MNHSTKAILLVLAPLLLTACGGEGNNLKRGGEDGCRPGYEREDGMCVPDNRGGRIPTKPPTQPGESKFTTAGFYSALGDDDVATISQQGEVLVWDDYYEDDREVEYRSLVRQSVNNRTEYTQRSACKRADSYNGQLWDHHYRFEKSGERVSFFTNCGERSEYVKSANRQQSLSQLDSVSLINGAGIAIFLYQGKIQNEQGDEALLGEDNRLKFDATQQACEQEYYTDGRRIVILPSDTCAETGFSPGLYQE
ncbi:hypothetical protein [Paraferrimonas sedimenticola]|uniref:Lipoprotein n=1 Tax=Paraferrimonas sedimenticola TaxID=375674 RepID=A0AA37RVP6_9GAMM|nr:hypothetical protein [Paraferrimonas sedimenticola]GLP96106.1 hypothetical protein GCM10007895_14120 [Paraferrimonas sedimenticola]